MTRPGSTQAILGFSDIRDDVVCLPGGHRAVLAVDGVNVEARGEAERRQLLAGFARLLNALEYRVQFLVRVRPLDIDDYLRQVEAQLPALPPPLALLALDHLAHVRGLIGGRRAMRRRCYMVIPAAAAARPAERGPAWRRGAARLLGVPVAEPAADPEAARASLEARCAEVGQRLAAMGLMARRLGWVELIELFHGCWNPGVADAGRVRAQALNAVDLAAALAARAPAPAPPAPPPATRLTTS